MHILICIFFIFWILWLTNEFIELFAHISYIQLYIFYILAFLFFGCIIFFKNRILKKNTITINIEINKIIWLNRNHIVDIIKNVSISIFLYMILILLCDIFFIYFTDFLYQK